MLPGLVPRRKAFGLEGRMVLVGVAPRASSQDPGAEQGILPEGLPCLPLGGGDLAASTADADRPPGGRPVAGRRLAGRRPERSRTRVLGADRLATLVAASERRILAGM